MPPALFVVCLAAATAGCEKASLQGPDHMKTSFPEYASSVLRRGSELARTERGFETITTNKGARPDGQVVLPHSGSGAILFSSKKKGSVSVREIALAGEGQVVDHAVSYRVPGGTSYWTATANGAEEWFVFEAGALAKDRPAAIWEVAGATPVQRGKTVMLRREDGHRVLTVAAPQAFLADGTTAPVTLTVRGARIELHVETHGQAALVDPSWTFVASMNFQRLGHTARRLTDGTVLVAGGESSGGIPQAIGIGTATPTSETYDEAFDEWIQQGSMNNAREEHAMVTQPGSAAPDGAAMVIGGLDEFGSVLFQVDQYDQADGFWSSMPGLIDARAAHTATRLQDDRVLVAGGYGGCGGAAKGGQVSSAIAHPGQSIGSGFCYICTAEVFDPSGGSASADAIGGQDAGAWSYSNNLIDCRAYHTETLLPDGSVLITGGEGNNGVLSSAEIWSPAVGSWALVAPMNGPRELHTATLLDDGTVLVAGGTNGATALGTAEIYDPAADTWTPVAAPMQAPRAQHGAVKLGDGTVLITGGRDINGGAQFTTETYDPAGGLFVAAPNMNDYHAQHTETLLASGNVLVAGGDNLNGDPPLSSTCEIYSLFSLPGAPCADASECGSGFCVDGVCCNTICDQPCEACTDAARGGGVNGKLIDGGPPNGGGSGGGDGFCGPVFQGEDPADDCASLDPSTCGSSGECDGNGACEQWTNGTICQVPGCAGDVAQGGGLCDGEGTCVIASMQDCSPYGCLGGVCTKQCVDPADCSPFAYCDGVVHTCAPKKPDGSVAFDPLQCLSGNLADGVCCDTPCDTACDSCSAQTGASADGVCTPLTNVQCDDGSACTKVDICQNGTCVGGQPVNCPGDTGCKGGFACDDKTGQCSIPTPPKNTGDPCDDGLTCTTNEKCDIVGNCQGQQVACTPGECQSGGTCAEGQGCQFTDKADYTPCTADNNPCTIEWCVGGSCIVNNLADLTPCPGGVCIGGSCIPDGSFTGGTGGGAQGGGGGSAQGGEAGNGQGGSGASGTTGNAGNAAEGGDRPAYELHGAGCSTSGEAPSRSTWAGALFALLGLAGLRRRKSSSNS